MIDYTGAFKQQRRETWKAEHPDVPKIELQWMGPHEQQHTIHEDLNIRVYLHRKQWHLKILEIGHKEFLENSIHTSVNEAKRRAVGFIKLRRKEKKPD